jgi:hypothetical protein
MCEAAETVSYSDMQDVWYIECTQCLLVRFWGTNERKRVLPKFSYINLLLVDEIESGIK